MKQADQLRHTALEREQMAPEFVDAPWQRFIRVKDTFGSKEVSLPRVHWITGWIRTIIWIQILIPLTCLVIDAVSDQQTPKDIKWDTEDAYHNKFTLHYAYEGWYAAYWANGLTLCVGVYGLWVYYVPSAYLNAKIETRLRRIQNYLCAIAVIGSAIASYFELRKWQVVSKGLIKKNTAELQIPFSFSLVTAFFQLLPGTASLFLPVLGTLIITESNRFFLADIPRFSCQGDSTDDLNTDENGDNPCQMAEDPDDEEWDPDTELDERQLPEDTVAAGGITDPTIKRRKVSDVTGKLSVHLQDLIEQHMQRSGQESHTLLPARSKTAPVDPPAIA
ncbi:hypothetical protein RvY_00349 [Ramazzottius varieornatus]|uniref:Uncharacterized protein n=1 Tax=Ramazzottius varieornatus TaxID=947166 RepID=A0A1D1UJU8_RAMVA|nr:hypothetical protein RvY_00349 [Ramazzottius varieornatus]